MSHPMYAAQKISIQPHEVPHTHYQVDYVAVNCGKMVAASKRRIRFKFGYTNLDALSQGQTGQDCRGSEHDVIITWSLSSGKQAIALDGREVFFDVGDTTKVNQAFRDKFGTTLHVKLHAAPVSTKANPDPDWRQYDLLVDGISFFKMPKIYEIGIKPKEIAPPSFAQRFPPKAENHEPGSYFTYDDEPVGRRRNNENETRKENASPPREEEPKQPEPAPEPVQVADLLSFDDDVSPAPAVAPIAAPVMTDPSTPHYDPNVAYATSYPAPAPTASFLNNQDPSLFTQSFAQTANQYGASAPAFASSQHPQPVYQAPASQYVITPNSSPGVSDTNYSNYHVDNTFANYQNSNQVPPMPTDSFNNYNNASAPVTQPSTANETSTALVLPNPTPPSANNAVNSLVNLDDLFGNSSGPITKQSVAKNMNDINATKPLSELKGSNNSNSGGQKKPVMNSFNAPPAYSNQQGMFGGYAPQQGMQMQEPQQHYNNYSYQQGYSQPQYRQPS
mmetsp:Transcript_20783/g.42394  ORF Transcript_20783/g.42394 Transcript_20783/m.42394 type:complete len:504 (+) Transcript_20783:89-1600(+)